VAELGHGIEAFNSVPAAIYSFLRHPDSFEEAVAYAISLGGDTDTIGGYGRGISGDRSHSCRMADKARKPRIYHRVSGATLVH